MKTLCLLIFVYPLKLAPGVRLDTLGQHLIPINFAIWAIMKSGPFIGKQISWKKEEIHGYQGYTKDNTINTENSL